MTTIDRYKSLLGWLGLLLAGVLLAPGVRDFMEASMLRHMLGALPLLVVAGALGGYACPARAKARLDNWNHLGIPGLLLTALIMTAWMIPLALDRATESLAADVLKTLTLYGAGFLLAVSLPKAQLALQLFFVWNWTAMTVFAGVLYQSLPTRLCSAYLIDDQEKTGFLLVLFAIAVGTAWCVYAWRQFQSAGREKAAR